MAASAALDGADKIAGVPARIVGGAFLRHPHPVFDFGEGLLARLRSGEQGGRYQSLAPAA
ncbi:MAG TPA: hypothetical protein VHE81_16635 [Lacipirellulaceae bacterium]|nr:hypothetical protein [Lacipirellulaceae bacterium]